MGERGLVAGLAGQTAGGRQGLVAEKAFAERRNARQSGCRRLFGGSGGWVLAGATGEAGGDEQEQGRNGRRGAQSGAMLVRMIRVHNGRPDLSCAIVRIA